MFRLHRLAGFDRFVEGSGVLVSIVLTLVVAAILIQVAVFSTTIFLHRTATHKALVMHPAVALSTGTQPSGVSK